MSEQPPDGGEPHTVHRAVRGRGVPAIEARIADKLYDIDWIDWLMHSEFS